MWLEEGMAIVGREEDKEDRGTLGKRELKFYERCI